MKIGLLEPGDFSSRAVETLERFGEVRKFVQGSWQDFVRDKEVLFVRLGLHIGDDLLAQAPVLRVVCSPTTGANHVDRDALRRRSIEYLSLKGETEFLADIRATPEHTFGLVLSLLRNYKAVFVEDQSRWDRDRYKGEEIFGNHVGIIGLGRVGGILARYFRIFGATVSYFDVRPVTPPVEGLIRQVSLDDLLGAAQIILLCASYEEGAPTILDARRLTALQGKYLVNTARGELLDEAALLTLVQSDHFAGVALDVLEGETLDSQRITEWAALARSSSRLILSPHIAGATYTSMRRTEEFLATKLEAWLGGG